MKRSYIKVYGPPLDKALNALIKLGQEIPKISKGQVSGTTLTGGEISGGKTVMGDYDFVFEWAKDPTERELRLLIFNIDEALGSLGCRYTITTK